MLIPTEPVSLTLKDPVIASDPEIIADPVYGNPAVTPLNCEPSPLKEPEKDPVATMVSVDTPLNASMVLVTCSA
jgi:hypothetical protein